MLIILILFLLNFFSCHFYNITGKSHYEVGYNLATQTKDRILDFYQLMTKGMSTEEIDAWKSFANRIIPHIEKYAPVSYEEMRGMGDVDGLSMEMISMMNSRDEFNMIGPVRKKRYFYGCTGFVSSYDGGILTGQTNDENPDQNLGKEGYLVVQRNEDSVVYTKPGLLIYMGMSASGIVSLYQYVDNGEYAAPEDVFLPSVIVIREVLEMKNIEEINAFLRDTPQGIPGNHMVSKSGEGFVNAELSFTNYSSVYQPVRNKFSDWCHTNNFIIDQAMMDGDLDVDPSSRARFETCRNMTKMYRQSGGMTVNRAKIMFNTPPILRDGQWENTWSDETMIYEPDKATMHIKWYKDKDYETYSLQRKM